MTIHNQLHRVADPFLAFWYRFVAPLASDLQFFDPAAVYADHVAPRLADYMGWSVFEEICGQWLQRHAKKRLGLTIRQMARYWSRDGRTEIDIVAELDNGTFHFAECKWCTDSLTRLGDLSTLQAKVAGLPEARWRNKPSYILFALGGFSPELLSLATFLMLIEQQIAERRERAAAKLPKILKRPAGGPYGDYTIKSASGRTYRVAIRGLGLFENYCSCPDFAINTLGTCKHVEALLLQLRKRHRKALESAKYSRAARRCYSP